MSRSRARDRDLRVIARQLGREPRGLRGVRIRCPFGLPAVVETEPFFRAGGEDVVFPTLYWLTCPAQVRSVGRLEGSGCLRALQRRQERDPAFRTGMRRAHGDYASCRWRSLDRERRGFLEGERPEVARVLRESGVGGIQKSGIKCLHAHYAHHLAGGQNPVGRRVERELAGRPIEAADCRRGCGVEVHPPWAVYDLGSNTMRMHVVEFDLVFRPLVRRRERVSLRLAGDLSEGGRITPDGIRELAKVLGALKLAAETEGAGDHVVGATSALREAENVREVRDRVHSTTGLAIEILSGYREARAAYLGVRRSLQVMGELAVIDVGGGSTEITAGGGDRPHLAASYRMGAVRLLQQCPGVDPGGCLGAGDREAMREALRGELRRAEGDLEGLRCGGGTPAGVGIGGTATTLAAIDLELEDYDPDRVHSHDLARDAIASILDRLCAEDIHGRKEIAGLPPERADIIVTGTLILHEVMGLAGLENLIISEGGLMIGLLYEHLRRCGVENGDEVDTEG